MTDPSGRFSKTIDSPSRRHHVELHYVGEIRFGPGLYRAEIDGRRVRRALVWRRLFGETSVWSADSRYLALTEWRVRNERDPFDTLLVVLDMAALRLCEADRMRDGIIEPVGFEGSVLTYTLTRYDATRRPSVERNDADVAALHRWRSPWW